MFTMGLLGMGGESGSLLALRQQLQPIASLFGVGAAQVDLLVGQRLPMTQAALATPMQPHLSLTQRLAGSTQSLSTQGIPTEKASLQSRLLTTSAQEMMLVSSTDLWRLGPLQLLGLL